MHYSFEFFTNTTTTTSSLNDRGCQQLHIERLNVIFCLLINSVLLKLHIDAFLVMQQIVLSPVLLDWIFISHQFCERMVFLYLWQFLYSGKSFCIISLLVLLQLYQIGIATCVHTIILFVPQKTLSLYMIPHHHWSRFIVLLGFVGS